MPEMITSAKNEKLRNVLLLQKKKKARKNRASSGVPVEMTDEELLEKGGFYAMLYHSQYAAAQ